MRKVQLTWIDIMGPPPTFITAFFDDDKQKVFVDRKTQVAMALSFIEAGIVDPDSTLGTVEMILAAPQAPTGHLVDVTDALPTWQMWLDDIIEAA